MKNYKISILLSIYQVDKYLKECLDSILKQTYKNIEVVCVDNGSKDNCHIILEEYKAKDHRIKIITLKENKKLCTGRNVGLDNSTGDYILFVDPDDILGPNYVEFMLNELNIAIGKNKSKPVYLVLNQNAYNFSLKPNVQYNNLEEIITKSNISLYSNIFEGGGYFLDIDDIAKNPNYELCIPMWGRLYESTFLKESNIRFVDGEMVDNIPFTHLVLYKIKKEWLTNKSKDVNNYYLRRTDDINVKDIEDISKDPSGNGETTSKVLFLETEIPYLLEIIYKECPGFRVPFTHLFLATYPRHRNKMKLLEAYRIFFKTIEDTVINDTKVYSRLDVDLLQAVLSSNYTEFDKLAYPSLFSEYQNYQVKLLPNSSSVNSAKKRVIFSNKYRLFNFLQIFKVSYFQDGKIFYFFGLPLIKIIGAGRKRTYYLFGIPVILFKSSIPKF